MPSRDWQLRIRDILDAIERIGRSTAGMNFEDFTRLEEIIQQGILYNFLIIGEAAINIPDKVKASYPQIPWRLMGDMRNVMAHEYFQVNERLVWQTIQNHLPSVVPQLQEILDREGDS